MSSLRVDTVPWTTVWFPNSRVREGFLYHVRLWNLVHELPAIAAEPLRDGVRVRLRSPSAGTTRLVEAFGGRDDG